MKLIRPYTTSIAIAWLSNFSAILVAGEPPREVLAGNLCATSPMGMAVVIDRQAGGIDGNLVRSNSGFLPVSVRTEPAPEWIDANHSGEATLTVRISPNQPLYLVAGWGAAPYALT